MILQKLKNLIFGNEENIREIQTPIVSKREDSTPSILSLFSPSILLHIQQEGVEYNITTLLNSFNEQLLVESKKGNFIVNFSHDDPNPKDIIALQLNAVETVLVVLQKRGKHVASLVTNDHVT